MGQMHNFVCRQCGYEAKVVDEGKDIGMVGMLVTVSCADCEALYNVPPQEDLWELWGCESPAEPTGMVCPLDPSHRVTQWTSPWPCPVCGGEMRNDHSMFCCWD